MRVQNTQEQKQVYNVFLKLIFIIGSFISGVSLSVWYFAFPGKLQNRSKSPIYRIFDFIVFHWPRDFSRKPSGYKITKYLGDFLQHIFLKK